MTDSAPLLAVADDLTGAAEIAALGHRAGLRSHVVTRADEVADAELTALDTDTRLLAPEAAAKNVATAAAVLVARHAPRLVYKKTDSVLRGPVLAELTALAAALGKTRILFVPCNPSLGRTIRGGRYYVNGVPLDQTAFACDPHHPAHTSNVEALLRWSALPSTRFRRAPVLQAPSCERPERRLQDRHPTPSQHVEGNALHPRDTVHVLAPGSALPATGVIVGEAASVDDVRAWAACVEADVLPAGGGEFFSAVLRRFSGTDRPTPPSFTPGRPILLVSGSLAATRRAADALVLPDASTVLAALARRPFVALATPAERSPDPDAPARLRRALAALVQHAAEARAFRHLMIEGGATAAEILATLGWSRLTVAREWAQGVVTLRPAADASLAVTMKPGSYAWPDTLWTQVAESH